MKFLVVDDHALTREGVRLALGAFGEDVEVLDAGSADPALALIVMHPDIDLVLLDIGLPGVSGFALLAELRRTRNSVPVVVISADEDRDQVLRALELGALGFIPKSSSVEVMLHAIRLVLAGGTYVPRQVLAPPPVSRAPLHPAAGDRRALDRLTLRQSQILALMAKGKPNKMIAEELAITEATVKAHVTEIFRVLGVTNRTQAVIVAGELAGDRVD